MRAVDGRQVRMLFRASVFVAALLSLLSLARTMNWLSIGRDLTLALGVALGLTSLCMILSIQWLRKRGLTP